MILFDTNRINRTLKRISFQIAEEAKDKNIQIVGLNQRGLILASIIQEHLATIQDKSPELFHIVDQDPDASDSIPSPTSSTVLVLVDDVIFSGGTMLRAMNQISELSGYNKIIISVLVDRGHRKYPLLASIIGESVPTKLNEHVELTIKDKHPNKVILSTD